MHDVQVSKTQLVEFGDQIAGRAVNLDTISASLNGAARRQMMSLPRITAVENNWFSR